jgi:hypothetical protein
VVFSADKRVCRDQSVTMGDQRLLFSSAARDACVTRICASVLRKNRALNRHHRTPVFFAVVDRAPEVRPVAS